MCRWGMFLLAICMAVLWLTGCGGAGRVPRRAESSGSFSVPLIVYRSRGAAAAFVGLDLEGRRYYFLVDSGAAVTVLDARVASALGLRRAGRSRDAKALGCSERVEPVTLPGWRLGTRSFGPTEVLSQRKAAFPGRGFGSHFAGLLGSDLLSRLGTVTIDFAHHRLMVGRSSPGSGHTIPLEIKRHGGQVLVIARVNIHHKPARLILDTGAGSPLIDSTAATKLGLARAGRSITGTGAVCRIRATPVLIKDWTIGGVRLPPVLGASAKRVLPEKALKEGVVGLIGTNALATFGEIIIDYAHSRAVLGATLR